MSCCTPWRREEDPALHDFYTSKLLEPGWGGLLTLAEAEYIRDCLERDSKLRRRWGIRRKKVPLSTVAEKALPEDPAAARRHIRAEQARARRKSRPEAKMSPRANGVPDEAACFTGETTARGIGAGRPATHEKTNGWPAMVLKRQSEVSYESHRARRVSPEARAKS